MDVDVERMLTWNGAGSRSREKQYRAPMQFCKHGPCRYIVNHPVRAYVFYRQLVWVHNTRITVFLPAEPDWAATSLSASPDWAVVSLSAATYWANASLSAAPDWTIVILSVAPDWATASLSAATDRPL